MFSVDDKIPYRLYFGADKDVDWIDIRTIYGEKLDLGNPLFEDLSPIVKITKYKDCLALKIEKKNSEWHLFYAGLPLPPMLKLTKPQLKQEELELEEVIYERY